jgi:hypothetical protein
MNTIYSISSKDRANGSIYNFDTQISHKSVINPYKFKLRILDLTIPYTFKQLNSTFNSISYTLVRLGTFNATITIPEGNYDIFSLLLVIKTKLIASILATAGVTLDITATYNKNTFHCTFGVVDATSTTISWTNVKLNKMLGFSTAISWTNVTSMESDVPVNVSPISNLFIRSDSLNINMYESASGGIKPSNILMKVPLTQASGSIIQYRGGFNELDVMDQSIDKIHLKITDDDENDISLNLDWSITLELEIVREGDAPLNPANNKDVKQDDKKEEKINILHEELAKAKRSLERNMRRLQG